MHPSDTSSAYPHSISQGRALVVLQRLVRRLGRLPKRHLCQVASQIVVVLLPHLNPPGGGGSAEEAAQVITSNVLHSPKTEPN